MTVPGGDSGEKAQNEAGRPPQPEQTPEQPEPHTTGDFPYSPPPVPPSSPPTSDYPPPAYPPPGYPPPGYPQPGYPPPDYPPPAGYGPSGYQDASAYGASYAQPSGTNTLAIAALVASLVGLLCGIGSIVGIVLGGVAINQIKQTRQQGYGLAVAGIVVGAATLVIYVIFAITLRMH